MKSIKKITYKVVVSTLLIVAMGSCNKEDLSAPKALHVLINGYNGSADELEVWIDTVSYDKTILNGKYTLKPASLVGFNAVHTYRTAKPQGMVTIKESESGKVLLSKPMPATGTKADYYFVYVDGKIQEVTPPVADPTTNKLGFYLHGTESADLVDVFLYRKDNNDGKEYREYLAKNVKPGTWVYVDYLPAVSFKTKNDLSSSGIYFTRAGTTDQWAFTGGETMNRLDAAGMGLPVNDEKGLVEPYFIVPGGWELEKARMFFYPDRSR